MRVANAADAGNRLVVMDVREHEIRAPKGRILEVLEAGDLTGPAIVVHHGTPSAAGLFDPWVADAAGRGVRLISFSRAGYGRSARAPGRDVAHVAGDVVAIADALGVDRFATWGASGGGPHALATAALLPDRVVAAATLASIAPENAEGLDFLAGMGQDNVTEFTAALAGPDTLLPYLHQQASELVTGDPDALAAAMRTLLPPVDRAAFTDSFGDHLAGKIRKALSGGVYGWLDDDLAFCRPWGFDFDAIAVPLQLWQGAHDLMVPYAHGQWLATHLPNVDAHLSDSDGHLTLTVNRIPEVHAWLVGHF